ncbi:hypothetical protein CEP52_016281 [Fusarium oligoseptatum]|uniref:CCHC-type domain-containing protein n=1 Tax=Fusarium oligoseptatum TaxID=2604345 RepID=A0A428S596_9HYPO|nr:hypothetical protein CEP52_016281 [Fusarium oligoseptatum]
MSAPPTAQGAANDQPCSTYTEQPQFSNGYLERVLATLLEEVRMLKAAVKELGLRLPAAVELEEYEFVDMRYMLKLDSDAELVNKLGTQGLVEALHKLGGPYLQIKSIRYIPKSGGSIPGPDGETISERTASLLIIVETYQAEDEIRNSSSKIGETIGFSANCYVLERIYQVQVEGYEKDRDRGVFPDWTTFFRHYTQQPGIRVRVRFNRFLIETTSLQTALLICRMSIKIGTTTFKAIPFAHQGTPMFCYKCNTPGHFQEVCGFAQFRCGRCSGQHSTASSWDPRCTDRRSQREHSKASYHRKVGPFWARWVNSQDPSSASKKQANKAPRTTEQEPQPQKRQKVSSTLAITPSSSTANKQAAPKNPPGRPSKFATASRDPRQQSILQYQVKVADSTATATKQSATELTPDTLGDTTMVETESDDSPEGMMDTEAAASDESAAAQGHHGNGDPVAAVQPTMETDTDMADYTMTDSQGVAESQVPVSGSGSDTASAEKKKKKNQSWAKKKGKKAASTKDEAQERAEGSGGTKSQEKTTSEVKVLKVKAHCPEKQQQQQRKEEKRKRARARIKMTPNDKVGGQLPRRETTPDVMANLTPILIQARERRRWLKEL